MSKSDYGKGLTYCLGLFAMHFNNETALRMANYHFVINHKEKDKILVNYPDDSHNYGWNERVKWWFDKIVPIYGDEQRALRSEISTWANGASDHLYDLCTESGNKKIDAKLRKIQNLGLKMGHGFIENEVFSTWENFMKLQDLTLECLRDIDRHLLKVEAIKGRWE